MIIEQEIYNYLSTRKNGLLTHRENTRLEFKEQFSHSGWGKYFCDFAAFANRGGGVIIYGVKNNPRQLTGLTQASHEQFDKIETETVTGNLLKVFSGAIEWDSRIVDFNGLAFGVIWIKECSTKPIIAKSDHGRDQEIKKADIFYRYGGRTERIRYDELELIIQERIERNNRMWIDRVTRIAKAGPENTAILNLEAGTLSTNNYSMLIDNQLVKDLNIINEGSFSERIGEPTLKLIGTVQPAEKVNVIGRVLSGLLDKYPYSATKVASLVREKVVDAHPQKVYRFINQHKMKGNPVFSAYNFRNREQENAYEVTGKVPTSVTIIYNQMAVEYIVAGINKNHSIEQSPI